MAQKFCRSCGFGLAKTVLSVVEQHPTALDENLRDKGNKLERLGVLALSVFGTGVFGLLLYLVGYKLMISQGKIIAGLGIIALIVLVVSGLLSVILFAKANEVKEEAGKRQPRLPDDPTSVTTTHPLPEPKIEPFLSVIEGTTELLLAEKESGTRRGKPPQPQSRYLGDR